MKIDVHEIFHSIQGETTLSGFSSVFIRLSGCNLRCKWCDTPASFSAGTSMSIDDIIGEVCSFPRPDHVTLTGGEPLAQKTSLSLMQSLIDRGYIVQLETNGSLPLTDVPPGVRKIVDIKPPSSGECGSFLMENLSFLSGDDEIKIVVSDENDLRFTENFIRGHLLYHPSVINLSPAHGVTGAERVGKFILDAPWKEGTCRVRLNLQVHRMLDMP